MMFGLDEVSRKRRNNKTTGTRLVLAWQQTDGPVSVPGADVKSLSPPLPLLLSILSGLSDDSSPT